MRYQVIVLATLLASSVLLGRIARAQDASADLEPMQLNRLLRIPSVKAALKLTPEQAASIQEIQGSMQEKMRQLFSEARREAGQTPDAERRREIVDKVRTTAAEFDEQLRKTLKPEQVARLRQVQLQVGVRRQIVELLTSPPIAAQLELSEAQGKDLRGLRQGPELRKQALELLTEAQREKLNELLGDPVDLPERLLSSRSFLSGGPAPDREAAARRSFQVFDRDGDGKITREEAERVRVGPTRDRSRIAQEFDTYDADSNGSVSLAEFTRQFGTRRPRPRAPERDREATAERIFKQLDADGDGQITREEANATRTPLARDFESFDANSDGNVTLEEFKRRFGGAVNANQAFERSFRSLDGDNDGKITRDEASKRPQSRIVEEFDSFDADSDGSVTLAEFKQQQFERAMASTSAVRAELIAQLESRYWPQRPRRQVTGEGDTLDSESLPGEGVWLDPALRRPNAPRFRVTVWFDRQFLGDGNAYTRRCQEFADQPRRQLRTRVIHTLKTLSDESYRAAKDELGKLVDDGQIDLVEWHWIVNGFSCVATNEGLAGLQKVPGVKKIFLARGRLASPPDTDDREPYFSPPAESRPPEPEGWKLPWYTRYLQADKVWKRLGVSGAGTLHVVMDGNFVMLPSVAANLHRNTQEVPDNGEDDDQNGLVDDYHGFDFARGAPLCAVRVDDETVDTGTLHGILCASIICGPGIEGGGQAFGLAPQATWSGVTVGARLEAAVQWAIEQGADTLSMSFSQPYLGEYRSHWRKVLEQAAFCGVCSVSGAGNFARENSSSYAPVPVQMRTPEDVPLVVFAPAGVRRDLKRTEFSSQGPVQWRTEHYRDGLVPKPDFCCFNSDLPRLLADETVQPGGLNGNSFAGPMVAGTLALMFSADPDLLPWDAREILAATTTDVGAAGFDHQTGHGLINSYRAVREVLRRKCLRTGRDASPYEGREADDELDADALRKALERRRHVVRAVLADSVAAQHGIRVGDVARSIDGRTIEGVGTLRAAIRQALDNKAPQLTLVVVRDGETIELQLPTPEGGIVGIALAEQFEAKVFE